MPSEWIQVAMATAPGAGGAAAKPADPTAQIMSLLPFVLIFVLFYVLFIVPQRKQQKEHQNLLKALKKGDEVTTSSGIFGTVLGFNERENTVYLKVAENVKVEIQRPAITGLRKPAPEAKPQLTAKP
jgi:preprotein translocase subunit YajC